MGFRDNASVTTRYSRGKTKLKANALPVHLKFLSNIIKSTSAINGAKMC